MLSERLWHLYMAFYIQYYNAYIMLLANCVLSLDCWYVEWLYIHVRSIGTSSILAINSPIVASEAEGVLCRFNAVVVCIYQYATVLYVCVLSLCVVCILFLLRLLKTMLSCSQSHWMSLISKLWTHWKWVWCSIPSTCVRMYVCTYVCICCHTATLIP